VGVYALFRNGHLEMNVNKLELVLILLLGFSDTICRRDASFKPSSLRRALFDFNFTGSNRDRFGFAIEKAHELEGPRAQARPTTRKDHGLSFGRTEITTPCLVGKPRGMGADDENCHNLVNIIPKTTD
jgi:hypothetical protein